MAAMVLHSRCCRMRQSKIYYNYYSYIYILVTMHCGLCVCCATRSNLPTHHHFECPVTCVCQIEHRQHASRLPYGIGRSSCEGIVQQCWILAERVPYAPQQVESAKKSDPRKTPRVVQVLFRPQITYQTDKKELF